MESFKLFQKMNGKSIPILVLFITIGFVFFNLPLKTVDAVSANSKEILFIDSEIQDAHIIVNNVRNRMEVVFLNENDGLDQVERVLSDRENLSAIHIVTHGSPGKIVLGGQEISKENIENYKKQLSNIGAALHPDGDVLFYGCDVAKGEFGQQFIQQLAESIGRDVAGSEDLTSGNPEKGNAVLESQIGSIQTQSININGWNGVLPNVSKTVDAEQVVSLNANDLGYQDYPYIYFESVPGNGSQLGLGSVGNSIQSGFSFSKSTVDGGDIKFRASTPGVYTFQVRWESGQGLQGQKVAPYTDAFTITISVQNPQPTNITLDKTSVVEGFFAEWVGTLTSNDNSGDSNTFSIVSDPDGLFEVTTVDTKKGELRFKEGKSIPAGQSAQVVVRVTDGANQYFEKTFTITCTELNTTNISLAPGESYSFTYTGNDLTGAETVAPEKGTIIIIFDGAEYPLSEGVYDGDTVKYTAPSSPGTDTFVLGDQYYVVTITSPNEAPTGITLSKSSVAENSPVGTTIGILNTTDPDAGDTFTYSLISGDTENFSISGNELRTNGVLDFESTNSYSVTVRVTDSGGLTFDENFTIVVSNVNEAPVLNQNSVNLTGTNEDTTTSEITISSFLDLTEHDSGALKGIAITGKTGNGVWQYFNSTWKAIPTVSNSIAFLLSETDKIRYVPDAMNGETATLSFRAWDQTVGSSFGSADVSINGGTTAFSSVEGTASLVVSGVNDAPNLTSGAYTFNPAAKNLVSNGVSIAEMVSLSDVDHDAAVGIAVYSTLGNGTWEYYNGISWQAFGPVSEGSSLLLRATDQVRYQSSNLSETASFTFRGWDQSSGTPGTKVDTTTNGGNTPYSIHTQTASIEIQKSNAANILSFSMPQALKPATISDGAIYVEVAGTQDVRSLVPIFTTSDFVQSIKVGSTVQTSGVTNNDFSSPVTYVVTAEDGTTKNWVVMVNRAPIDISLSNNLVDEKVAAGTVVGTLSGTDLDTNAVLSYGIQSGNTDAFEIDQNRLITKTALDYNTNNLYNMTIRVTDQHGAFYDKDFIIKVLDKTPPTADVIMTSNNEHDPLKAKVGDSITLNIVANEEIATPIVTVNGNPATVSDNGDADAKTWAATYEVTAGDAEGLIGFTLDFQDINGNAATQVSDVASGGIVTIDKTAPTAAMITIRSNNTDATKAKIGDTITLDITTDEDIQQLAVTIAGKGATVTNAGDSDAKTWQATYTMLDGDQDGNVGLSLNFKDLAGNTSTEVTSTTDASSVIFDGTIPTPIMVSMSSSNGNPEIAKVGDTITLQVVASEAVQTPNITIAGKGATVTNGGDAKTWQATYTLQSGDPEGPIPFTMDLIDLVGNVGTQVTTVTSGSSVIFDKTIPTIQSVTMTSNNAHDPTIAKVGDTINLTIVASEDIQSPTVTIAGKNATISDNGDSDAKTWTASYMMEGDDVEGAIEFTLDFQDIVQNPGMLVTYVTSGRNVFYDNTIPTAIIVTISSTNADPTKAKVGDNIRLSIFANENVKAPTITMFGKPITVINNGSPVSWLAQYTMQNGDSPGPVEFTIDIEDIAGNRGTQITETTDDSSVMALSNNANLSSLTLSNGIVDPDYSPNETSYNATVSYEVTTLDVTPVASDATSTVKLNDMPIASGAAANVPLALGPNTITVEVTAQDGTTKTYTITVTRLLSNNADLSTLILSEGTLSPDFNLDITNYSTNVDPTVSEVTLTALPDQSDATVVINGNATTSDTIALNFGSNSVPVVVTAQDGMTTKHYMVTINRLKSGNADLDSLSVNRGTLTPTFSPSVDAYQVAVPYEITQISVSAQVEDAYASLTLNGKTVSPTSESIPTITSDLISNVTTGDSIQVSMTEAFDLKVGSNPIPVTVTAQDGGTKVYTIIVNRAAPPNSDGDDGNSTSTPSGGTNGGNHRNATVDLGNGNSQNEQIEISRSTTVDGKQVDVVVFQEDKAKSIVEKSLQEDREFARIVIDDLPNNPADEVEVTIPKGSVNQLVEGNISLEIQTNDVRVAILQETLKSLQQLGMDLYFNIVPIKDENEKKQVEERTLSAAEVQKIAGNSNVVVHGKPMIIETNYKNYPTKVVFPLTGLKLPSDPKERKALVDSLAIYIEHSDGEKKVQKGKVMFDDNGNPVGLEIEINKFSTFTIISVQPKDEITLTDVEGHWAEKPIRELVSMKAVNGYPDGTFKPNTSVTRAEFTTMVVNALQIKNNGNAKTFDDIQKHWAKNSIEIAAANEVVNGLSETRFGPDETITREQMAAIIVNAGKMEMIENKASFKDYNEIGSWAEGSVNTAAYYKIVNGLPNQTFNPKGKATRAEAAAVIMNLLNK
ncbi:DUF4347 domain-containing protein [Bacillus sp. Marseille-P3661]|uniref:DUF4347 domain-containing protein n=1 Tax=Bacillus sp. Marseille-P3661 TaxID=1936234 RepID=UPI000C8672A7|nr:DUF4347 domain-containing protein [Bacillus sp. Marseille-P3661]